MDQMSIHPEMRVLWDSWLGVGPSWISRAHYWLTTSELGQILISLDYTLAGLIALAVYQLICMMIRE